MAMSIFKKKGGHISATSIPMTEAEAALAQSDFNIEKITEIQNKFAGGAVLLVPGRIFIREGLLWKVCRKGIKKRQFFLFNDILVYGSVVASRYSNQHSLALDKMSVSSECFYQPRVQQDFDADAESLDQQLDPSNAFQISHADKSFHVFASSAADKANWLANLNKHISRAAQFVADNLQQIVTRPVWVPDAIAKECMICQIKFSTFVRKHHCRRCGQVVCSSCSPHHVSLTATDLSVGGHTPSGVQGKLERVCKECFKEMTAQHNRSNSQLRSPVDYRVSESLGQDSLSNLSAVVQGQSTSIEATSGHDSTDTEDSDDSADEESAIEQPSKVSSQSMPEDGSKIDTVNPVGNTRNTDVEKFPNDAPDVDEIGEEQTSDVQPTPPPRKKKLEKLLKKQIEAREQGSTSEQKDDDSHSQEADSGDGNELTTTEKDRDMSASRKVRRKYKHTKTLENTQEDDQETSVEKSFPEDSNLNREKTSVDQQRGEHEFLTDDKKEPWSEAIEDERGSKEEDPVNKGNEESEGVEVGAPALTSSVADGMASEKLNQEQFPSAQKRARGRRKKFKTTADRTDVNT